MEHCAGCESLAKELTRLVDDLEELQDDYRVKVKEFDEHKGDLSIKLVKIDHKLDQLADEFIDHMNAEMEYNKKISEHIKEVSVFMATITTDRKWFVVIGAALIGVFVWFYTQQYLPQIQHMNEQNQRTNEILMKISEK